MGKKIESLSTDEWINRLWHTHTMEYYSTIIKKENKLLIHATTWMNFESMMKRDKIIHKSLHTV